MRDFSCKFNCSFIRSLKSSLRLCSPCALKLEDVHHVSSNPSSVADGLEERSADENVMIEKIDQPVDVKVEILPKSSLKKSSEFGPKEAGKGRVKWMDMIGNELVEIKEFEPIEAGELDEHGHGNPHCICVIQ